jgi:hypothetical protein
MGLFTKWQTMLAFTRTSKETDPAALLAEYNEWAPKARSADQFSFTRRRDESVLGWVRFERKRDARKARKFLRKSPLFNYVQKGEVNMKYLDHIVWGVGE